jgi:HK97 family phage major capsid protein
MHPNELRAKRQQKMADAKKIADRAKGENRDFTAEERADVDAILAEVANIDASLKTITNLLSAESAGNESMPDESAGARSRGSMILGMDPKEQRRYSILRALRSQLPGTNRREAGLELEASAEIARRLGRDPQGVFVPYEALGHALRNARLRRERRDLTITTEGADVRETLLDVGSFIDLLRNKMILAEAGVTTLSGLTGNVDIPRQSGGATVTWLAEQDAAGENTPTLDKVSLTPRTAGCFLDMSRKFIQQSAVDADAFAENDLTTALALALDAAGLHGSGASNQPTGVASTAGIGSVAGGANGAAPTWANIVTLETEVAQDNADMGNLAYITNTKVRGKLKQTAKVSSTDSVMIWQEQNELNGHRALVSNQVSSTLTKGTSSGICSAIFFGNWADLIMAFWGVLDLLVDPYTASSKGDVRVVAFQDVDIAVRHPESFAAMLDALTT